MVDFLIVPSVVRHIEWVELAVFDYWTHASLPEFVAESVPVIAFVRDNCLESLQISGENLPADLGVVRLFHRAINVENRGRITIDECRGFDVVKVVADANHVMPTGFVPLEASRVDGLDVAELVERRGRPQQDAPDAHFEVLLPPTHGGEVGEFIHREPEFSCNSGHLMKHVE